MLKEIFQNTLLADLYGLEDGEKQQKFLRRTLLNAATAAAGSGACPPWNIFVCFSDCINCKFANGNLDVIFSLFSRDKHKCTVFRYRLIL